MCAAAAAGGHPDILLYLKKNACPWDESIVKAALDVWEGTEGFNSDTEEVLRVCAENDCPWPQNYPSFTEFCEERVENKRYLASSWCAYRVFLLGVK